MQKYNSFVTEVCGVKMKKGNLKSRNGMWREYQGDENSWSQMLLAFPNKGYLNDVSWGRHLNNMGWSCLRWAFIRNEAPSAYCQGFLKKYPFGVGVLWIPDGIIGDYKHISSLHHDLYNILNLRFLYIRFRESQVFNVDDYIKILVGGWSTPKTPLGSSLTMMLDISGSLDDIKARFTKNWRRTLKKSTNEAFQIVEVKDPRVIADLYLELKNSKALSAKQIYSDTVIESVMQSFEDNLVVLGAMDIEGNIVAIRGAICHNGQAADMFAAMNPLGRSMSASHAVLMALLEACKQRQCAIYDLSGIDPANSLGVYNFKKGTGAEAKASIGEFEWSNKWWLQVAFNRLVKYRE